MSLKSELQIIKGRKAKVTVGEIHDWAQDHTDSEWHQRLEWDDKIAGRSWRIWQIRYLLTIQIDKESNVREFVSLSIDRQAGGGYRFTNEIMEHVTLQEILLADALKELQRLREKYGHIRDLIRVWSEIDRIDAKHKRKRKIAAKSKSAAA